MEARSSVLAWRMQVGCKLYAIFDETQLLLVFVLNFLMIKKMSENTAYTRNVIENILQNKFRRREA